MGVEAFDAGAEGVKVFVRDVVRAGDKVFGKGEEVERVVVAVQLTF